MNEEYVEKPKRGLTVILVLVVLVGVIIWFIPQVKTDSQTDEESVTIVQDEEEKFVVTEAQWNAVNKEIKQLRNEVAQLRNELAKKTNAAPAKRSPQTTTKPAATTAMANTADITLESYSHDLYGRTARLSFKNNTNDEVTSITGRMIYYDMSGNMLDYRDFTKSTAIDPGMVKSVDIEGFRTSDNYVYYKNMYADLGVKYKVKFQLKSYKKK
jgi:hypothetical protein